MVESPTRTQGLSPTFQASSVNTRANPVPTANYGNEFESYLVSALNDSLIRKSTFPSPSKLERLLLLHAFYTYSLSCILDRRRSKTVSKF